MPTIIFKATEACNSNCIYCDVVHRKQPRTIPLDILEVAYQRINEYLLEHTEDEMHIIWHGGEPCMAGLKLYTEALRFQETYCAETKGHIKYAVQSNLPMINQDFIDVKQENNKFFWGQDNIYNVYNKKEEHNGFRTTITYDFIDKYQQRGIIIYMHNRDADWATKHMLYIKYEGIKIGKYYCSNEPKNK